MKLKVSVLVALLPAALALPSPSPSNAGDIDLSDLADLPAPSEVPVDVVSSSVNLVAIATSLAAEQSITFQASVPTATPLRKRQTSSCQAFSKYASANPDVTNTVQGFQSYFTDASSSLDGYGLPIYTGVNSAGPKNGLLSINTYTTYDPSVCKAKCDGMGNCQSFAIWRERVPQQKYDANACPIPSADAAYQTKCLYYSYPLQTSDGSNKGQWTNNGKFYVAQTSVKFFNKTPYAPPTISKFNSPVGGYGTCAPAVSDADKDKVLTASGTYYAEALARDPGAMSTVIDPSFCASQCQSITKAGAADPTSGIKLNCNMFSLFLLRSNGKDFWQCQYFTKDLDASHNTKCASGAVVASWKYVLTNPAPSYVNTNPPTTPPTCTGSDSSTFGVRCIEDLNDIEGRSDVNVQYTIKSAPGESHYYHKTAKLIGFEDPSGNEYYIHDTQFRQNDATYLSTDKTFGLIYNDSPNTYTLKASGFVFDLESIDLAGWFLTIYQRGATMTLYGMRDGAIVTQASPALQIPSAAGQPFAHATGLLDLGFKKIDSLRIVTSIDNYGLFAFDNLVLTRYASNTPRARRHLESVSGPVVVPSTLRKRDDLVFSGTVSPIASEMYVFANGTSTQTQTASK